MEIFGETASLRMSVGRSSDRHGHCFLIKSLSLSLSRERERESVLLCFIRADVNVDRPGVP